MKLITTVITLVMVVTLNAANSYASEEKAFYITKPPASIKQWYKPENKRQVWLHTMFRLRREMQAISEYTAYQDAEHLRHWVTKFSKDYRSIGEMVPEWRDELEIQVLEELEQAATSSQFDQVGTHMKRLGRSCGGCHKEFRAVSAALYRGANFSAIQVENSETMEEMKYKDAMSGLSTSMNRIKIASVDGRFDIAASAYKQLDQRMNDVAESCSACHSSDKQKNYLFDEEAMTEMKRLGDFIDVKNTKQTQRTLGSVAVKVCSKCHSIHRTLSDLRKFIDK